MGLAKRFLATDGVEYARKWGPAGVLIGLCAGAGALALLGLIGLFSGLLLAGMAGYVPPAPGGEASGFALVSSAARPWALPLAAVTAAVLGALLIRSFAPEAAGIGTDAAIAAFHSNRAVRLRAAVVKAVASALTLGGGLTSGREGPVAQIGAGAGSTIANLMGMGPRDRRIALAAGLGAGIAAIFRAPLAGAILGAEVFYRNDFEVEAFFPGIVASVTSYTVMGYAVGFHPIFDLGPAPSALSSPTALLLFAALGVACALVARLLVASLQGAQRRFRRFPLVPAAACGALATSLIGLAFPTVIGAGYGWVQLAMSSRATALPHADLFGTSPMLLPLIFVLCALLEVAAVSLSIGSGNSGGVFGPSIVAGGFLGAAFGSWAALLVPGLNQGPASFAVVGMVAFFAAAAKSPLATIVMIAEMTGGYALLGPSMVAVFTAFLLSGPASVFAAQVRSRFDSQANAEEFAPLALRRLKVEDVMRPATLTVSSTDNVAKALAVMSSAGARAVPVVDGRTLAGLLTRERALSLRLEDHAATPVSQVMSQEVVSLAAGEDLYDALERMLERQDLDVPIVRAGDAGGSSLLGIVGPAEIAKALARERSGNGGHRPPDAAAAGQGGPAAPAPTAPPGEQ